MITITMTYREFVLMHLGIRRLRELLVDRPEKIAELNELLQKLEHWAPHDWKLAVGNTM